MAAAAAMIFIVIVSLSLRSLFTGSRIWRERMAAQQLVGPRRRGIVVLADLGREPAPDQVQVPQHRVDGVYRVGGTPPGERIRLPAVLPDAQPGTEVLGVLEERRQRGVVVRAGAHRDHRLLARCLGVASQALPPPCAGLRRIACWTALSCADDGGLRRLPPPCGWLVALLMRLGFTALRGSNPRSSAPGYRQNCRCRTD